MVQQKEMKTITIHYDVWELLIKFKIDLRHKNMSETLRYMFDVIRNKNY